MSPSGPGSTVVYSPTLTRHPAFQKVRFGDDRIFCNTSWSVETYSAPVAKVCVAEGRNRYRQMIEEAVAEVSARKVA